MTAIDTITLKTAVKTSGIHLPVGPWETNLAPNPGPKYVRATDWSGGLWQKILPKEEATTNMVWAGTCWTVNGNEIRCGPLRTAQAGTAITAAGAHHYLEVPVKNVVYFAAGAKKYYLDSSHNPTELDAGGSTTITDVAYSTNTIGAPAVFYCLGTNAKARYYRPDTDTWATWDWCAQVMTMASDTTYWAASVDPAGGTGAASHLYSWDGTSWGDVEVGASDTPITHIVEYNKDIIIFKTDGMYLLLQGSAPEAVKLQTWPPDANNGKAVAVYNGGLYFSCGDGLWVWRGTGMAQPVPVPSDIDSGQIGKVYSLCSIDRALLVGFLGWAMILVEDGPTPGYYWWHYLATNSGKQFSSIFYTVNAGFTRPRIYFAFNSDSTNNVQYTELVSGDFLPYEYATGSYVIFPGIYMGPEMYACLYHDLQCGTRNCAASKTVQWATTTTQPNGSPSWTNFGDAITTNGFQTVEPSADTSGQITWFKATLATNTTTTSPILDWVRWKYYPRVTASRVWSFPLELKDRATLPGGGRQASIDSLETDLVAARNQTNPCTLTIPSQGVTDVKVMADMKMTVARSNPKRSDVTAEEVTLILREVV